MKVAGPVKVELAFTNRLLAAEVPIVTLPRALSALPAVMLTAALAVAGAAKVVIALTPNVLLEFVPMRVFPSALKALSAVMLTGALAVTAAVAVNSVTALTVRVCAALMPMAVLPLVDRLVRSVLPVTVRVLDAPGMATLPVKVAKPLLSMVKRSASWLLPVLVLPVVLVLKIRLPPSLPDASCRNDQLVSELLSSSSDDQQLGRACILLVDMLHYVKGGQAGMHLSHLMRNSLHVTLPDSLTASLMQEVQPLNKPDMHRQQGQHACSEFEPVVILLSP